MTIPLAEFLEISQAPRGFGPGRSVDWILDDEGGGARANMAWDAEADVISGGVQERGVEDPVLHFVARIRSAEVDLVGVDGTGETSAPEDPRGILSGFRRQIRTMTASAHCKMVMT